MIEEIRDTIDNFSYARSGASGSFVAILLEFATNRGEEIIFLFIAGFVGMLGGLFAKWLFHKFFKVKNEK